MEQTLAEKILLRFSVDQEKKKPVSPQKPREAKTALSILTEVFPNFLDHIKNKAILDFGCGQGQQSTALVSLGAKYVLGLDTNPKSMEKAKQLARDLGVNGRVEFAERLRSHNKEEFDIVISQNSMEHFFDPENIINEIKSALKQNGEIFITFGPPWYAPYGSHMNFFTSIPWINILFSEKTVLKVRSHYRNDGAKCYEEVESGLNKMSVKKFERIVQKSGLKINYKRYDCVKGLDFFGKIPFLRELFINRINCILTKGIK